MPGTAAAGLAFQNESHYQLGIVLRLDGVGELSARLAVALADAHRARLGLPSDLEALVRLYAHAHREAGSNIGAVLIEVKALVRDFSDIDAPVVMPKVVGWTVAGYFAGTNR